METVEEKNKAGNVEMGKGLGPGSSKKETVREDEKEEENCNGRLERKVKVKKKGEQIKENRGGNTGK